MQRFKRIVLAALCPPEWLAALIVLPSFGLLIHVFLSGREESLLGYASYGLSAYALIIVCMYMPKVVRAFRSRFERHPQVRRVVDSPASERYRTDPFYRAEVSLYAGLGVNLLYAGIKLAYGIIFRSVWFGSLAGYYLLLALMRFLLLFRMKDENLLVQWKRCRLCALVLLVMTQTLAVLVFLVTRRDSHFEYPGLLIYAMAAYTFYALTASIISMVRFRHHPSPVITSSKIIGMTAALVSVLSLETAMLYEFGSAEDALFRRIMTGVTGTAVCAAVMALAVWMIAQANRQMRRLSTKEREEPASHE